MVISGSMLWVLVSLSLISVLVGIYNCYLQDLKMRNTASELTQHKAELRRLTQELVRKVAATRPHNMTTGTDLPKPTLKAVHLDDEQEARALLGRWQSSLHDEAQEFMRRDGTA